MSSCFKGLNENAKTYIYMRSRGRRPSSLSAEKQTKKQMRALGLRRPVELPAKRSKTIAGEPLLFAAGLFCTERLLFSWCAPWVPYGPVRGRGPGLGKRRGRGAGVRSGRAASARPGAAAPLARAEIHN